MWCDEGHFFRIKWMHRNLVVAGEGVQKWQHPMPYRGINDLVYSRQEEAVFWAHFIEVRVVHAYPPCTALLWDDHYIGKPFRVLHLFDKTHTQKIIYLYLNNLMAIRVEMPYLLSNRFHRGDNVQFMRGQC